jgi:acyl-coenzyme A thioesterase PaaI-like protein
MSNPSPEEDAKRDAALRALCSALRRTMELARVSEAPASVLDEARAALESASKLLEAHAHPGPYSQSMVGAGDHRIDPAERDSTRAFPYSPVIGAKNPISPPIAFRCEGDVVRADATLGPLYVGPLGAVHGGIVALVFDELLGAANLLNGVGAYTGTLTIRYRKPTPLQTPLALEARVERIEGRKATARGEIRAGGAVTAEAEGVFIVPVR